MPKQAAPACPSAPVPLMLTPPSNPAGAAAVLTRPRLRPPGGFLCWFAYISASCTPAVTAGPLVAGCGCARAAVRQVQWPAIGLPRRSSEEHDRQDGADASSAGDADSGEQCHRLQAQRLGVPVDAGPMAGSP